MYVIDRDGPKTRGSYCWIKQGSLNPQGYGLISRDYTTRLAHRMMYSTFITPLPVWKKGDLILDHLCRRRACANPRHLELVTHRVNAARGIGDKQAAVASRMNTGLCLRGHNNWRRKKSLRFPDTWECRDCSNEAQRRRLGLSPTSASSDKTRCKRGHEFTPENTYVHPSGSRVCRACKRMRARGEL